MNEIKQIIKKRMHALYIKIKEIEGKKPDNPVAYIEQLQALEERMFELQELYKDIETTI